MANNDTDQFDDALTYDDIWTEHEAVGFSCVECGNQVYLRPPYDPECVSCGCTYDIEVRVASKSTD